MINKTFKQLNAERAARRARPKRMRLSKIIKELNKENAPPDGWRPEDKVPSPKPQAPSTKLQASSTKRRKLQAASLKPQAASVKLQAASDKLHDS